MYEVLRRVVLGASHVPTGRTQHLVVGSAMPTPAELHIVAYPDDHGIYLLYLDQDGNVMTDTYHATVEDAMAQAEYEFQVTTSDWTSLETEECR